MTDLVVANNSPVEWTREQVDLLKSTICKGATDDEFKIFCHAVKRTGLDPFMKQIHAVKRKNSKTGKEEMTIQTGIDGYRVVAHRTGLYAGIDPIIFDDEIRPKKATATVYRLVQGVRCAFTGTARWAEFCPPGGQDFMWKKMPCVMLGKVAESVALRMAFPAELSGMYTNEEMEQADAQAEHAKIVENESQHLTPQPVQKIAARSIVERPALNELVQRVKFFGFEDRIKEKCASLGKKSVKELTEQECQAAIAWIEQQNKIMESIPEEKEPEPEWAKEGTSLRGDPHTVK